MIRITNCAICSKALIRGWDTNTGNSYPYNVLNTYTIDHQADEYEGVKNEKHRNKQRVIICNECMLCVRKLINMKKEEVKNFKEFLSRTGRLKNESESNN